MYALPKIFKETPQSFLDDYRSKLAIASEHVFNGLSKIKGIQPIKATASMYMMVRLHFDMFKPDAGFTDDKAFVLKLWEEESVLLLPSQCFYQTGFVRIVTCISIESADEFLQRFSGFINRYLI
jgi:tyrosine aminotransferase